MIEVIIALVSLVYFVGAIFSLGPTLINDEYAAVDYIYRVVKTGHFFSTPEHINKPLSLVFGLTGLWETVIPFEVINAVFASLLAVCLFRLVAGSMGFACAVMGFILVFTNPDPLQYAVTGSTVMPFAALAMLAAIIFTRMEKRPGLVWAYAVCFLIAGLSRPAAWLFATPLAVFFWFHREKTGLWRLIIAIGIIEIAPLIWFSRDLIIEKDILHSMDIATKTRAVGSGAHFTLVQALYTFPHRLSNKMSWPTFILSLVGAAAYIGKRGIKSLLDPLVLFPAVIAPYTLWIAYSAHAVHRYFFFLVVFALVFAGYAWVWLFGLFRSVKTPARWLALFVIAASAVAHCIYTPLKFRKDINELRTEAAIQKDMVKVAEYLKAQVPEGQAARIMLPSRRNEQLSWLFRDREAPWMVGFREAYYLDTYKGYWFLNLEPQWMVYYKGDFHFRGSQDFFDFLNFQDHTTLRGVKIDLVHKTDLARIFRVTYPPDWPEPPPVPSIP